MALPFRRETCGLLAFCLVLGSICGAFGSKLCSMQLGAALESFSIPAVLDVPIIRKWLRIALLPAMMSVALVARRRWWMFLLFFGKAFLLAYLVCLFSSAQAGAWTSLFPLLFFETVLPLPILLYVGSVWIQDIQLGRCDLLLLLPAVCSGLLGILLETLLF